MIEHLIEDLPLACEPIFGGKGTMKRIEGATNNPTDIVIGTSGTLLPLFRDGELNVSDMKYLLLDEVDVLLGDRSKMDTFMFLTNLVREELDQRSTMCQINMFGATIPKAVLSDIQRTIPNLKTYVHRHAHRPQKHIDQRFWFVTSKYKPKHFLIEMRKLLADPTTENRRTMVFCNHTSASEWLSHFLTANSIEHIKLNKNSDSQFREALLDKLATTNAPIITTDIGSRGLDLLDVKTVINFEFPYTYEDYIHRIGRTGRLGSFDRNCLAISYVSHKESLGLYHKVSNHQKGVSYPMLVNPSGVVETPVVPEDVVPLEGFDEGEED